MSSSLSVLFLVIVFYGSSAVGAKLAELGVEIRYVPCERFVVKGDFVHVYYTGRLYETKEEFDSNVGGEPLGITVGAGQVIAGWEKGLIGTCEGEQRRLLIPSEMAYGSRGYSNLIPPNSDLEFDIELVRIDKRNDEL
ncbi:unnamed protein product [Mesocestoides corti]|uniref:peptidylprolyl isomerase n=1 Tax=Mesocestoides corti TaxID=53468 RepID=A0A0R3UMJ7_MESCO|nr:unnamed protein product [Mesocestoides corti]